MKTLLFACAILASLPVGNLTAAEGWGTIKGKFVIDGKIFPPVALGLPAGAPIKTIPNQKLVIGAQGELSNACLWLIVPRDESPPQPHPSHSETANAEIKIDLSGYLFQPYLTFIRTSQKVKFENLDPVAHNIKFFGFANPPEPGVVPIHGDWVQSFTQEERVPCPFISTDYPWMEAFLLVRNSPYAAISDQNGAFEIAQVPAGTWTFQFWHPSGGYLTELKLLGQYHREKKGEYQIEVFADQVTDLGEIVIAARNLR